MKVPSDGLETGCFLAFFAIALICFVFSIKYSYNYRSEIAFVLPPLLCLTIMIENLVLAIHELETDDAFGKFGLVCRAIDVPFFLVISFELTYLIHKRRSVNFCGIRFDDSHRNNDYSGRVCLQTILRFSVWAVALFLFVLGIFVNFEYVFDESVHSGRKGLHEISDDSETHFILSLTPTLVLLVCTFYFGVSLWLYGTQYSLFKVHPTPFNPWIWMFVGAVALLAGQLMPTEIYPITANAGEVVLLLCLQRMFPEVIGELEHSTTMASFIQDPTPAADAPTGRTDLSVAERQERDAQLAAAAPITSGQLTSAVLATDADVMRTVNKDSHASMV
jgi:hypothetical protein